MDIKIFFYIYRKDGFSFNISYVYKTISKHQRTSLKTSMIKFYHPKLPKLVLLTIICIKKLMLADEIDTNNSLKVVISWYMLEEIHIFNSKFIDVPTQSKQIQHNNHVTKFINKINTLMRDLRFLDYSRKTTTTERLDPQTQSTNKNHKNNSYLCFI